MQADSRVGRADRIMAALRRLERRGVVRSCYVYAPGDSRGRRWVIDAAGFRGERSYSTVEIEAFVHGAEVALELRDAG
jgi:hypothetical protein